MAHRVKESDIQRAIVNYVRQVLPDAVCFAVPNAARRGKSGRASNGVPGLMRGVSDLCVVLPFKVIFAEVKTDKGKVSPEQRGFGMRMMALGHSFAVWRSIDDVRRTFEALQIRTRETVL